MTSSPNRIENKFAALKKADRAAFVPFIMAGDPDLATSQLLLDALPAAGADIIELGVCFTDPMADGPAIQEAGLRALAAGQTLRKTLAMVTRFRQQDQTTPIILMGYYNPVYAYGVSDFLVDAKKAGMDGLIIVDLPPEEDGELCLPAKAAGLDFIRLATPTTDAERLPEVVRNISGFVYYVSVAGVTGGASGQSADISMAIEMLRNAAKLPVAVGFGIKTPEKAAEIARKSDAVVVGSALIERLAENLPAEMPQNGSDYKKQAVEPVLTMAKELSHAVHTARLAKA